MRITAFNTECVDEKDRMGLKAFPMNKLGEVVLLAGKNGSGKSRILRLVSTMTKNASELMQQHEHLEHEKNNLLQSNADLENFLNSIGENASRQYQIDHAKDTIWRNTLRLNEINLKMNQPPVVQFDCDDLKQVKIVNYVPTKIDLADGQQLSPMNLKQKAEQAKSIGCSHLNESAEALIQVVYNRYWNTTHQSYSGELSKKQDAVADMNRLQEIVSLFLGSPLERDEDGAVTIFGKSIYRAGLSDGQKILLQLCVAIYAQGAKLSDYILVMDEPENHLHPSAVIEMVDKIRELNPEGQIWIATHSIALLSHFDPSYIWYVKDGSAAYSGRKPEQVLESLLGDEENIQRLHSFIGLPDEFAANRFAFECLLPPGVADPDAADPQFGQLKEILESIWSGNKEKISLLDYGAGKGRMISNLSENSRINAEMLDYVAFDEYAANKDACVKNIGRFYSDAENRYFNTMEELQTKRDDKSFDLILMCNVLHEIPHSRWIPLFKDLKRQLKDDGKLLLIEDCKIPVGELPHQKGFVVLNTLHLKDLFSIPATENAFIANDARPDREPNRLMAHLIPCCYLDKITSQSMKKAFEDLRETSIRNIMQIRKQEQTYKNGMAHAFWTQQLANATLCLEEL